MVTNGVSKQCSIGLERGHLVLMLGRELWALQMQLLWLTLRTWGVFVQVRVQNVGLGVALSFPR